MSENNERCVSAPPFDRQERTRRQTTMSKVLMKEHENTSAPRQHQQERTQKRDREENEQNPEVRQNIITLDPIGKDDSDYEEESEEEGMNEQ